MQTPPKPEKPDFSNLLPDIRVGEIVQKSVTDLTYGRSAEITKAIRDAEIGRFQGQVGKLASKYPKLSLYLAGAAGACLLLGLGKGVQISSAKSEIERRKDQLNRDTYDLKGSEATQVPWNKENLNEWLYRPVRITGRPMHNKAMLIPRDYCGYKGFDYIVPLVTNENEDGSFKEGVLLNKGWMPHEYKHVGSRWRIENALPQTFEGYVSLNSELDEKNEFFKEGNSFGERRSEWSHVYLPDMAEYSGLKNVNTAKLAIIECVNKNSALDERLPKHFSVDLNGGEDYPYPKTRAGALQLRRMPWDLQGERNSYFLASVVLGGMAGVLRFVA